MIKILAAAMLIAVIPAFSQVVEIPNEQTEEIDKEFLQLLARAKTIARFSVEWNAICADTPGTEQCAAAKTAIEKLEVKWIVDGGKYHEKGEGCFAKFRVLMVKHTSRVFGYNLNCVGAGDDKEKQCTAERGAIAEESNVLDGQMATCESELHKDQLL